MNGFWGGCLDEQSAVLWMSENSNPHAPSNTGSTIIAYRQHENFKWLYSLWTEIEHASFTPIVMAATGRLLCSKFYLLFFPEFPKNFAHYSIDHYLLFS